jgi:hypothetical protein
MADNMQFQLVQEACLDVANCFHETIRVVEDSLVTFQDDFLTYVKSFFQTWLEMLTSQIQSTPCAQSGGQPTQQLDASQRLRFLQRRRMDANRSEVAALRARLDREYEAYNLFCNGFAVTASHAAINKRMQALCVSVKEIQSELVPLIGNTQARSSGKPYLKKYNKITRPISAKICAGSTHGVTPALRLHCYSAARTANFSKGDRYAKSHFPHHNQPNLFMCA